MIFSCHLLKAAEGRKYWTGLPYLQGAMRSVSPEPFSKGINGKHVFALVQISIPTPSHKEFVKCLKAAGTNAGGTRSLAKSNVVQMPELKWT